MHFVSSRPIMSGCKLNVQGYCNLTSTLAGTSAITVFADTNFTSAGGVHTLCLPVALNVEVHNHLFFHN